MAFFAAKFGVITLKSIACISGVVKFYILFPAVSAMAFTTACRGILALEKVNIIGFVAAITGFLYLEESGFVFSNNPVTALLSMAVAALGFLVCAC